MTVHEKRVDAVKDFAQENKTDEHWKTVLELTDEDIYHIVKQTQSTQGAIRKVARLVGSDIGRDLELPAPIRTQAQHVAEEKLRALAGTLEEAEAAPKEAEKAEVKK